MHIKKLQKKGFVELVLPANLALYVYVSTHNVEIVKTHYFNRSLQLTRWPRGNALDWMREVPGSSPGSGFFVLLLLCFYFLFKNHLQKFFKIVFAM